MRGEWRMRAQMKSKKRKGGVTDAIRCIGIEKITSGSSGNE